jgi:DNA polymerase
MGANYGVSVADELASRIVASWRARNPKIVEGWKELQVAGIEATRCKGLKVPALDGRVHYLHANGFLYCRLPSGGIIAYPGAVVERKEKIVIIDGEEVHFDNWGVSYWGEKRGWRKLDLYGGAQMAHVVSGTARDIMADRMLAAERAGYPIVLTVHDELLAEVPDGFGSVAAFQALMEDVPAWCAGLPVTAKAWEGERYAK